MEEYNKPTLNSIITDFFFAEDTSLNKSYKNASIVLQMNYDETCTMQEYLKHICYLIDSNMLKSDYYYFLVVGICGGLTTFSAFSIENFNFIKDQYFQI